MLRFLTAGESHGPGLVTIVEGLPAGLEIRSEGLATQLGRRRLGFGRGRRMMIEKDELEILAGVRHGRTLGSPLAVVIRNTEWARWAEEMSPEPGDPKRVMATPRPGHADLAGMLKYDTHDARDILERASARETAARTVAGYAAGQLLRQVDMSVLSHVVSIGSISVPVGTAPGPGDLEAIDDSPVRVFARETEGAMTEAIEQAKANRDTLGGVVEILAFGAPAGLGSHVHWDRRLDSQLAGALMSIQGIKAVEIGDGLASAARPGSEAHDEIGFAGRQFVRQSDRAGGLEGGISTGQTLRMRAAMKPISTLMRPLKSVDVATKEPADAFRERSDVCAVPAAGVVAEQMVAYVLAAEVLRKFGGDTVADLVAAVTAYRTRLLAF
ncbi:MAG: chorismate synthase [Acidimicrobiia bacterium]|nr:chorismate synthase [Acidimicrobiia bacterium]MDH3399153.1 chorismate synthase [Acidimicrobiia bacterium]MDH5616603.1 chorismate synthase [Acidimicrobiia bacterium]